MTRAQDGTTAAAHADGSKVYRLTETTIATGNAADNGATTTATTIDVTLNTAALDAAVNSYIQIGSEVMLVTAVSTNELTVTRGTSPGTHADGAKVYLLTESTLDGPLTDSATTVNVDLNTAGLGAAANSYILIGSEVLLVTSVSTNALTVTRAQHGTTAAAHLDGAKGVPLEGHVGPHAGNRFDVRVRRRGRRAAAHRRGQRHRRRLQVAGLLHGQGRVRPLHVHVPVPARPQRGGQHVHVVQLRGDQLPDGHGLGRPAVAHSISTQAARPGIGDNTWAHYRRLPCSGAGLCTAAGKCSCFANFFGPACERRVCPGGSAETGDCSGHGTCATMKQLSMLPNALPLSKNNVSGYHAGDHVPYYEHHAHGRDDGTWDAMRLYGCVCDSSWPVGLGPGETQEPVEINFTSRSS